MRRSRLNPFLKSINRALWVRRPSNRGEHIYFGETDGVYFYNQFMGAVPPGNIYRQANKHYLSKHGGRHRSLQGLMNKLIEKHILRRNYDKAIRQFLISG